MWTICMNGKCLKKLTVNGFEWVEELSQFNEDSFDEKSDEGYFLEVDFFKLINTDVFGKTMENLRKHRDKRTHKRTTTDKRRNQLASEPNYHTTKYFPENLMAIEMKKTKVKMNKPIYLGMSILDISKILMYEFCYDYIKPKYWDRAKLCYMNTEIFVIHIKTEDCYEDIADDVEKWSDTSNYNKHDNRRLPIGKNKKLIGLSKNELGGKIMKEFVALRAKTYSYLMDDDSELKKAKGTKKVFNKKKTCLKITKIACLMIKSY